MKQVGNEAFQSCDLQRVELPRLESVGQYGFASCPFVEVNLPALKSVKSDGFRYCQFLESFSAPNLREVGEGCFSHCPQLSSIKCDLKPEQFVCQKENNGCGECPVCFSEVEPCLERGKHGRLVW